MSFDETDPDYRVYAGLVKGQFGCVPNLAIASGDDMYAYSEQVCGSRILGLMAYLRAGMQINDTVRQIVDWHFGPERTVARFLDFASGYGRSTRFLEKDIGAERVWASDILPDAMRFQAEQFGVHTIPSTTKPENFKPGMQFDCVFVSSLFSHLPETTFTRWLWKLYSLLAPGGLLIFSVHNEATLPAGTAMPRSGIHFRPLTEIPSLDVGDYGETVVADHFVQTAIAAVTGSVVHQRIAQGLCFTQDVYLVPKGKMKPAQMPFQYGPNGCVDFCRWTEPEQMKVTGWAFDATEGERITRVEVHYNGVLRGTCELNHVRPDVAAFLGHTTRAEAVRSGWDCVIDLKGEKIRPEQDWMLVKAVSSSGKQFVLRLDHPANVSEFESLQGWTYTESNERPQAITAVLRFIDHPPGGRFRIADSLLSGWVATKERHALQDLRLQGRFGLVPFSRTERPDVVSFFPEFEAMGFRAILPPEYLTVTDPRLRFLTRDGVVLATLDSAVEGSAIAAAQALAAARNAKRKWCLAHLNTGFLAENLSNVAIVPGERFEWNDMAGSDPSAAIIKAQEIAGRGRRVLVVGAGLQNVADEKIVFLDPVDSLSSDVVLRSLPLPFRDAVFDAVIYVRPFALHANPTTVMQEFLRVLTSNGVILSDSQLLDTGQAGEGALARFERADLERQMVAYR